jgi:glucose-6-phosphate isomerase
VIAITDPETALHRRAVDERFRDVFINPPDIGGRFSALSFFGLVPAAMMGIDVDALVGPARAMADACRTDDPRHNPGLSLGAFMAAAAYAGRHDGNEKRYGAILADQKGHGPFIDKTGNFLHDSIAGFLR